jgi:hypothetical protein
VLAHGADKKRIGTNQINDKDVDGKAFVRERLELAKTHDSFWQSYKFLNPVTKKIEPKPDVLRAARTDGRLRRRLPDLKSPPAPGHAGADARNQLTVSL